jgi:uncharacterized protein
MRLIPVAAIACLGLAVTSGQTPAPHVKRLLVIGETKGFEHDSVPYAMGTLWKLGHDTGLWETYIRTDTACITKKKREKNGKSLNDFDVVYFDTTGELDMDDEQKAALLSFVHDDGKGLIGGHTGTDTFFNWPAYGDMIGGYFDGHPWHQEVRINIDDNLFPGMRQFGPQLTIDDEIYQLKSYSREKVRVLMSLDTTSVDMKKAGVHRTDGDFPIAWARSYGKGRVFSCSLGHETAVYDRPDIQKMYVEAIKWAMGMSDADVTPRPIMNTDMPAAPDKWIK